MKVNRNLSTVVQQIWPILEGVDPIVSIEVLFQMIAKIFIQHCEPDKETLFKFLSAYYDAVEETANILGVLPEKNKGKDE